MWCCRLTVLDAYNLKYFNIIFHTLFSLMLIAVELIGDQIPNTQCIKWELRLILDNGVHGAIAAISWLIVVDYRCAILNRIFYEVFLCGSIGSLIDLDHFIEARSFHIKDAINLLERPMFHNTTFVILMWTTFCLVSSITISINIWRLSWIIFIAGISHHIRDGIKHGLLLSPFGSTALIPYWSYILITVLLPHVTRLAMNKYNHLFSEKISSVSENCKFCTTCYERKTNIIINNNNVSLLKSKKLIVISQSFSN